MGKISWKISNEEIERRKKKNLDLIVNFSVVKAFYLRDEELNTEMASDEDTAYIKIVAIAQI